MWQTTEIGLKLLGLDGSCCGVVCVTSSHVEGVGVQLDHVLRFCADLLSLDHYSGS